MYIHLRNIFIYIFIETYLFIRLKYFPYPDLSLAKDPPPLPTSDPMMDIKLPPESSELLNLLNNNVVRT